MKPIVLNILLLFIIGTTVVGCQGITYYDVETDNYTGPQTVDALMRAFDTRYTSRASNAKWVTAMEHLSVKNVALRYIKKYGCEIPASRVASDAH